MSKSNTSRRALLRGTGGVIAGGALGTTMANAETGLPTIKRPRLMESPTEVLEHHEIPTAWWNHIKTAENALNRLEKRFSTQEAIISAGLVDSGVTRKGFDGLTGREILVKVAKDQPIPDLPSESSGIPVRTQPSEPLQKAGTCYNLGTPDPAFGGNAIEADKYVGTSGFAASYFGTDGIVTCEHLWEDYCNRDLSLENAELSIGTGTYQDDFGRVEKDNNDLDSVFVEPFSDYDVTPSIWEPDNGAISVEGYLSSSGVNVAFSTNRRCHKVGVATGHVTGRIDAVDAQSWDPGCQDWNGEGVELEMNGTDGDSGGPVYVKNDSGGAELVSLFTEYYPCYGWGCESDCDGTTVGGQIGGPCVYEIANQMNLSVLT